MGDVKNHFPYSVGIFQPINHLSKMNIKKYKSNNRSNDKKLSTIPFFFIHIIFIT